MKFCLMNLKNVFTWRSELISYCYFGLDWDIQGFLQLNDVHIFGYSRTKLSDDELRDRIRGYGFLILMFECMAKTASHLLVNMLLFKVKDFRIR